MSNHKSVPPSTSGRSGGWNDDDVPEKAGKGNKPVKEHSLTVRVLSGFVGALMFVLVVGALIGAAVAVFQWIAGMLM